MPADPYKWFATHPFRNYSVSADGEVRCGKNPIKIRYWPDGSPYVLMSVAGRRVEVPVDELIMLTFIGRPPHCRGYRVGRRNGDKTDCRAENLFWEEDPAWHFDFYSQLMAVPAWYAPGLKQHR